MSAGRGRGSRLSSSGVTLPPTSFFYLGLPGAGWGPQPRFPLAPKSQANLSQRHAPRHTRNEVLPALRMPLA